MLARMNKHYVPAYWDDFFNDAFFTTRNNDASGKYCPSVNVAEDEKEFRVEVAVPGLSKKDVRIDLEDQLLTISSEQKEEKEESKTNYMRREFSHRAFKRSFELPDTVDREHIKANHDAGVVTIHLPKKEEMVQKAPKQIEIK